MSDAMKDEIFAKVREAAVEVLDCDPEEVTLDAKLSETLDADSIDVIEIASSMEREYGVAIEDHEVYDLTDVNGLVELVARKRGD
ncbi:MAG: acyl carrier protein [Iamia sp.]